MYAEGDGVAQNDCAPSNISAASPTAMPMTAPAAACALRRQCLRGARPILPRRHSQTEVKQPIQSGRAKCSHYAASYFGDPDAQYYLARLYLDGVGAPRDPAQAARWLGLAAQKGQYQAQAMLGDMLFEGEARAAPGGARPDVARAGGDSAGPDEGWISEAV